ncbi:bifunctional nuclease domain-containing protein [Segatella bryantii]|uniref:bifunctional nuclease domain-containing protein n=1 Tax=Segatella bryantii TaxID=77095 RepID=UPI00241F6969|nr:bifunctional nuclease domain-containing protein [Segatella bryantii]
MDLPSKIELKYWHISEVVGVDATGVIILVNQEETKQLSITCNQSDCKEIQLLNSEGNDAERRLPSVFAKVLAQFSDAHFYVLIHGIVDGEYKVVLVNSETLDMVPIRAADAIILALASHLRIYISEELMKQQQVDFDPFSSSMRMPINGISDSMLQQALNKAIAAEDYEMASHIRDEVNRRKHLSK